MSYRLKLASDIAPILWAKAKREGKKVDVMANQLLRQALWNEPEVLFKGREYRVQPDLFGDNKPSLERY
jgi:hypothetical protein